ncbi:hypothetical protein F511_16027 [Dorcoceras hygrometricum]|uniref:Uncharacterized protein n=1 Tax=Dorcoceras hygrometricum TaxID=472368 RepID=A0A2Z7C1P4_9LAMI|nr:hypothetical protein F511_16027 [Dorcoceras hygrometricum]
MAAAANIACGHAAAPSAAPSSKLRPRVAHPAAPSRNCLRVAAGHGQPFVAQPCAKQRPAMAQQLRKAAGPSAGQRAIAHALMRGGAAARIQLAVGPQPLWLRNHNFGLAHRIMVKRLATSPHDPLGITDSACKNQLVVVSVQYGPFYTYIPIRSTTTDNIGYPRVRASGESSTTNHRLLHASGPHPIPPPSDPKTNQYNQDLGLFHSTNGNHLKSPNEGSSIDHQVNIHLHAQNITMFPTNETWYFTSQMLVSSSGGLILILTAQSTRNEFRMHSDY